MPGIPADHESDESCAVTNNDASPICRPFRPKRRTLATIAKERGLEPLATRLIVQPLKADPLVKAAGFITEDVPDDENALAGARDIISEMVSDDAALHKLLRGILTRDSIVVSKAAKEEDSVYRNYYDFREPVRLITPHHILAIDCGEKEAFLEITNEVPGKRCMNAVRHAYVRGNSLSSAQVAEACDGWST